MSLDTSCIQLTASANTLKAALLQLARWQYTGRKEEKKKQSVQLKNLTYFYKGEMGLGVVLGAVAGPGLVADLVFGEEEARQELSWEQQLVMLLDLAAVYF